MTSRIAMILAAALTLSALSTPSSAGPRDLVLVAGGDVSYHRGSFDALLEKVGGSTGMFHLIQSYLDEADLRFINLETPLTNASYAIKKTYQMAMPPERFAWILKAGFNMISLANNHTADAGADGVRDTVATLEAARDKGHALWWAGAHPDREKAWDITYFTPKDKDMKVAFLAFGNNAAPQVAKFWGKRVFEKVREARANADLVIVSVHFGKEYQHVPNGDVVRSFRKLVDSGADVVLGHHPHVISGVEKYKSGVILYSLGNFSFASFTARHHETGAKLYGMLPLVYVTDGKLSRLRIVPLYVNNREKWTIDGEPTLKPTPFQPQPLEGAYARVVLDAITQWSAAISGNTTRIAISGDEANVDLTSPVGSGRPAVGSP